LKKAKPASGRPWGKRFEIGPFGGGSQKKRGERNLTKGLAIQRRPKEIVGQGEKGGKRKARSNEPARKMGGATIRGGRKTLEQGDSMNGVEWENRAANKSTKRRTIGCNHRETRGRTRGKNQTNRTYQ